MKLVTVDEAARELHVSSGLVRHWVRQGWLARHARPRHPKSQRYRPDVEQKRFYVDVDAARVLTSNGALEKFKRDNPDGNFLTTREVSKLLHVTYETVIRMLKDLEVTKHHYHNDSPAYVISGEELHSKMEDHPWHSIHLVRRRASRLDR